MEISLERKQVRAENSCSKPQTASKERAEDPRAGKAWKDKAKQNQLHGSKNETRRSKSVQTFSLGDDIWQKIGGIIKSERIMAIKCGQVQRGQCDDVSRTKQGKCVADRGSMQGITSGGTYRLHLLLQWRLLDVRWHDGDASTGSYLRG